jgi:hypothetical protein
VRKAMKISDMKTENPVGIRTGNLQNTSVKRYSCSVPLFEMLETVYGLYILAASRIDAALSI